MHLGGRVLELLVLNVARPTTHDMLGHLDSCTAMQAAGGVPNQELDVLGSLTMLTTSAVLQRPPARGTMIPC